MTDLMDTNSAHPGAAAAHSLVTTARAAFDAAACSISTLSADGTTLRFLAVSGAGEGELEGRPLPPERGLAYWSLRTGMSIAADDLDSSADFNSEFAASTGYVPSSILVAPISGGGSPTGIIQVLDRVDSGRAEAGPISLIEQFADLAGRLLTGNGDSAHDDQQASAELIRETGAFLLSGRIRSKEEARRLLLNALRDLG